MEFYPSWLPCGQPYKFRFEANPIKFWYSAITFMKCSLHEWARLMVGSHDRRSLQLFPKMYYYASSTRRSETTLPLENQTTAPCNRFFPSIPYPQVITFCLVWQHHDVFHIPATASERLRIGTKSERTKCEEGKQRRKEVGKKCSTLITNVIKNSPINQR